GWVSNPFPFMYGATVCALPSRYESFGYTTLEAMVLGKPVVATAVAGSRDLIVPGETGELTPPGNRTDFTEALVQVLTDPGRAARLGSAAAVRARMFSRERMATEMLAVYRSLSS
ncbi:MAG: glycosyltransferase family 4 protein, partial [Polaromonas sp.]|nr:glycosyltransferase family 4 protein [Gemmatimonadaceae bacterium]